MSVVFFHVPNRSSSARYGSRSECRNECAKITFFQTAKIIQGSLARSPINKMSPIFSWGTRSGGRAAFPYNMILFSALSFYCSDPARSLCISMFFAPYFTFSTFFPLTTSLCLLTIYGKQKKMIFIELPTRHSSFQCKNK